MRRYFGVLTHSAPLFLALYGTGFRNYGGLGAISVRIGGLDSQVLDAGAQGSYAWLEERSSHASSHHHSFLPTYVHHVIVVNCNDSRSAATAISTSQNLTGNWNGSRDVLEHA